MSEESMVQYDKNILTLEWGPRKFSRSKRPRMTPQGISES
jgi:hypothetical protein